MRGRKVAGYPSWSQKALLIKWDKEGRKQRNSSLQRYVKEELQRQKNRRQHVRLKYRMLGMGRNLEQMTDRVGR